MENWSWLTVQDKAKFEFAPDTVSRSIDRLLYSGVARAIVFGGGNASAEGASHSRGVREHAPPENFEI